MHAIEMADKDPTLPCFSLGNRQRLGNFVGREEILITIDQNLLARSASDPSTALCPDPTTNADEVQLRSFAICGLGGIGKTELAVEYAYSRQDQFEAIFWLGADKANILASSFAQIAQTLGLEEDDSDLAASRDIVMGWLAKPLRKASKGDTPDNLVSWLIIFDNVDEFDVLADFWPKLGRGSVLVTSRDPAAKRNLYTKYKKKGMDLPQLSEAESETLMQQLTHVTADAGQTKALAKIVEKVDGFPLAISQMSAVFRDLRLSYSDFLKYYEEEGIERLLQRLDSKESIGASSLATLWALERLFPATKALLQVISLLDPDNIPEDLLIDRKDEVKLDHYPKTRGEYYDARSQLLASSLVVQNADQQNLSLHRLIQDTARALMDREQLELAFRAAGNLVISAWTFQKVEQHHSTKRFEDCEKVFPSVLRLKNGLEPFIRQTSDFVSNIRIARLFNDTGW